MLIPTKHTDPSLSLLNISGVIIGELCQSEIIGYVDLQNFLQDQLGKNSKDVFVYALSFLFILGKIEYLSDIDAIRIVKNENM